MAAGKGGPETALLLIAIFIRNRDDLKELGNKMCRALEDIGFCYLKNHEIPDEQVI
jgi:isopenicillin N synthase-like dioxygenase